MEFTSNNLTFVIVTFNSRKVIYDCLNSLPKDFHKLIIENSSDEELKKELEQNYDKTEVVLSKNIGMGAGNNLGIIKSNTQYVYVLNPDVTLKHDTILNINNSISELDNFAILSPVSDNSDYPNYKISKKSISINKDIIENVEEIDGYSMIINKNFFSNNSFFDERIFMYLENDDVCLRMRKRNEKILICGKSLISHFGAKTVDDKYFDEIELSRNWHWNWSKFYFRKKHYGFINAFFFNFPTLIKSSLKCVFYFLTGDKFKLKIQLCRASGFVNSFLGKRSWYRPRLD